MRIPVVAPTFWRWPSAEVITVGGRWMIAHGGPWDEVMPLGVEQAAGSGNRPDRVQVTLHEMHEALREVAVLDVETAAQALAQICRSYPVPALCEHGLPPFHPGRPDAEGCSSPRLDADSPLIDVVHVQDMITGLDGVRTLAQHVAHQRRPASRRMWDNATVWPVVGGEYLRFVRAEIERDGEVRLARARQLVTMSLQAAFRQARVQLDFEWSDGDEARPRAGNRRPEMVLLAETNIGAYLVDFARHVIDATALDTELVDRSVTCQVCGDSYRPRRQPAPGSEYCASPECQRERARRNQARSRARRKDS